MLRIAVASVGNLFLVRAGARRREIALLACALPARAAPWVDPMATLRSE